MTAATRTGCPFDHHSPEYAHDFRSALAGLRDRGPLVWSDEHGGFWIATTYEMVRRLATDNRTLTVAPSPDGTTGGLQVPAPPGMRSRPVFVPGEADGDDHTRYRRALNPHFTKRRMTELGPMIQAHVDAAVDRVRQLGEFDVVHDLGAPIIAGVSCTHLGLEVEDPPAFFRDCYDMMAAHGEGDLARLQGRFQPSWDRLAETVRARRATPRDDVISHLVTCESPSFTDDEVQRMTLNVILGSAHTTPSLLSQALVHLDTDRDLRRRLSTHPDEIPRAVEEFLRFTAVAMGNARTAIADLDIDGQTIRTGDRILLSFASANHDAAEFDTPEHFDMDRPHARHAGMGLGAHFCLGAWLARAVAATTLRTVLDRIPGFVIDHDRLVGNPNKSMSNRLERVPATVTR